MKKIIALVLALCMVLGIGAAFAADEDAVETSQLGSPFDEGNVADTDWSGVSDGYIAIGGLDEGDYVQFYRVLAYDQDARGILGTDLNAHGWTVTGLFRSGEGAVTAADLEAILTTGITAEMAGRIAKNAKGKMNETYHAKAGSNHVASVTADPGLYVAIVTPKNAGWMFNPVFVACDYYKTGNSSESNSFTPVTDPLSYSFKAMAKKAEITVDKTATEANEDSNETHDAKAVAKGDVINFTVKTTIPEFAENYTSPVFVVNDVMTSGLALNEGTVLIKIGNTVLEAKDDQDRLQYTLTSSATGYKVVFAPEYLLRLEAATDITITYNATITESAVENVNEEDNTVTVIYSHEPTIEEESKGKKVRDKTHHYTFTIDGNIWGDSEYKTTEVVKVGLDKNGNEIEQTTTLSNGKTIGALVGAKFRLYTNADCADANEYDKGAHRKELFESDSEGRIEIEGLDAGTYWLKEVEAPAGYIRQQNATKIEIIPTYYDTLTWTDADGCKITSDDVMKSYLVKIDGVQTAEYVINYEMDSTTGKPTSDIPQSISNMKTTHDDIVIGNHGPITTEHKEGEADGKIQNTQGTELPSTGGIGTTIFYILGGLLVIGAAVILVARRKAQD